MGSVSARVLALEVGFAARGVPCMAIKQNLGQLTLCQGEPAVAQLRIRRGRSLLRCAKLRQGGKLVTFACRDVHADASAADYRLE